MLLSGAPEASVQVLMIDDASEKAPLRTRINLSLTQNQLYRNLQGVYGDTRVYCELLTIVDCSLQNHNPAICTEP